MESTFDALVADLTRDAYRVQPKDVLQFCAAWFQSRLEEQRARMRDSLARLYPADLPSELYSDTPFSAAEPSSTRSSAKLSLPHRDSPFGTLNVPGNALLSEEGSFGRRGSAIAPPPPPTFRLDGTALPLSPLATGASGASYTGFDHTTPTAHSPSDYLHPPTASIFARRTSVSAESIAVDSSTDELLPVYPKTADQLRRIKASIAQNFIFRDLDEEQETGVLNAMQEMDVKENEVVIRQGDVGEYFYVVEKGYLHCFIQDDSHPAGSASGSNTVALSPVGSKAVTHPEFGRLVAEYRQGKSFGELALMYGHPRAATVVSIEPSTLWSVDRITFRTIILKAAHRRRTMYEHFLSTVTLLSSLQPEERSKIADALVSKVYQDGEAVVREGEMGDTFFFVEEGEAVVTQLKQGDDGEMRQIQVGHLTKGDYFGELSLLRLAPRAATVSAIYRTNQAAPKLKVAALDAPSFTRLLGPLRDIMERQAGARYGPSARFSR